MSRVRLLVGTHKGAFILSSDGKRDRWDVNGPHFPGWEVYHIKGSPALPNRMYAAPSGPWLGQRIQRSDNGGISWEAVGSTFAFDGPAGTHQWYTGAPRQWEFARIWHVEPSPSDPDVVYAGGEDAALFRSSDGGMNWREVPTLRNHESGPSWKAGACGMCLHTILLDPNNPDRIFTAISGAGAFRSNDGGASWHQSEAGQCVHRLAMHPSNPKLIYMQRHGGVMRSNDGGGTWENVNGNLPADFGFAIEVHANEPETLFAVPLKSETEQYPVDGKLRVYRSRSGGTKWEALTTGLPQRDCYVSVLRDAMAVDQLDPCGIYFGTTGGAVYGSCDNGESWTPIVRDLPGVFSVEVQTFA